MDYRILVINSAYTTTRVAVYEDNACQFDDTLKHPPEELAAFDTVWDQFPFRRHAVEALLQAKGVSLSTFSAIVSRGGLMRPVEGGTYEVTEPMLTDLQAGVQGEHAANLGAALAYSLGREARVPAYVVDPVAVDEMTPVARLSGVPELPRRSLVHALNLKARARQAAAAGGKPLSSFNAVLVHLGRGISVAAMRADRMVDVTNAFEGGPFSPERAGTLPAGDLVRLAFGGKHTERELVRRLTAEGGLRAYLGTADPQEVEHRVEQGDPVATLVYEAMAYQVAKEIGAMACAIEGSLDAIVLTGDLAASERLVDWISDRVSFMGPVLVYPGGDEMAALAAGALRVVRGEETLKTYPKGDITLDA
ncbi:MAG: butyrate kinase [Symbiobacteriia bacterium]